MALLILGNNMAKKKEFKDEFKSRYGTWWKCLVEIKWISGRERKKIEAEVVFEKGKIWQYSKTWRHQATRFRNH